jgi:hypothetical protein
MSSRRRRGGEGGEERSVALKSENHSQRFRKNSCCQSIEN